MHYHLSLYLVSTGVWGCLWEWLGKTWFWPRGSTGVQRYGCILRSAANNLGEIPLKLGAPNPLFQELFLGREHFGTRPCQSPSRFGIRLHFLRPPLPLPQWLLRKFRFWGWFCWEQESIHRPVPVQDFSLQKKMGSTEERFRWWIWFSWFFYRVFVSTTGLESFSLRPEFSKRFSFGSGRVRFFFSVLWFGITRMFVTLCLCQFTPFHLNENIALSLWG